MFRSRVFGPPDAFNVALDYGSAEAAPTHKHKIRLPVVAARLDGNIYTPSSLPRTKHLFLALLTYICHTHCSPPCSGSDTAVHTCRLEFDWTGSEVEASVIDKFKQRQNQLLRDNQQERVKLHLIREPVPHAASFPAEHVSVQLEVTSSLPVLRSVHFSRTSGSGKLLWHWGRTSSLISCWLLHLYSNTIVHG